MKKLFILLGMLAGVVAPSLAHANPDNQSTKTRDAKTHMVVKAPRPQRRTVYYITTNSVAGSHIPTVVRRYQGGDEALNGGFLPDRFFSGGALNRSNGTNIGTSLAQLDPSITVH